MSTLQTRITDLATRVATECKSIRTLMNANGSDLSALTTTQKTSLVAAINELKASIAALGTPLTISDSTSNTTHPLRLLVRSKQLKMQLPMVQLLH